MDWITGSPVGRAAELVGFQVRYSVRWEPIGFGVAVELDVLDPLRIIVETPDGRIVSVSWLDARPFARVTP